MSVENVNDAAIDIEDLDSGRVTTAKGGRSSRLKENSSFSEINPVSVGETNHDSEKLIDEINPATENTIDRVPEDIQKEIDRKNDLRILEEAKANSKNIAEMMRKKQEATDVNSYFIFEINLTLISHYIIIKASKDYTIYDYMEIERVKKVNFEELDYNTLKKLYLLKTKVKSKEYQIIQQFDFKTCF